MDYEEALDTARFFEKNVNVCLEYDDAWIFKNSKKRPGLYNPVVVLKEGDAIPASLYKRTTLIGTIKIPKK
ncbi:MAG: hypothetical protein J6U01_04730 [Clostridia bacterium]|nr:hypothetical protein [Clostridia bacterium]